MEEHEAALDESLEARADDPGAEAQERDLGDGAETVHLYGDEPRR